MGKDFADLGAYVGGGPQEGEPKVDGILLVGGGF